MDLSSPLRKCNYTVVGGLLRSLLLRFHLHIQKHHFKSLNKWLLVTFGCLCSELKMQMIINTSNFFRVPPCIQASCLMQKDNSPSRFQSATTLLANRYHCVVTSPQIVVILFELLSTMLIKWWQLKMAKTIIYHCNHLISKVILKQAKNINLCRPNSVASQNPSASSRAACPER